MSGMYDDADAPEEMPAAEATEADTAEGAEPADADEPDAALADEPDADEGAAAAEVTGHPAVDAMLASLEGLEQRPVGEHAAVFESAHDALRRALNDAGEG